MISYQKRQGLYEISIGVGEESYEEPSDWLNDCDRAIGAMCLAISPCVCYLTDSIDYPKDLWKTLYRVLERTMRILLDLWRVPLAHQFFLSLKMSRPL